MTDRLNGSGEYDNEHIERLLATPIPPEYDRFADVGTLTDPPLVDGDLAEARERIDREADEALILSALAAGEVPPRGLPLVSLATLRQRIAAAPPVQWLVDGLLPADGVSLFVGPPKSGKSTLARCLVHAAASGDGKWLGRSVRHGSVLHLCLEEREVTLADHYARLGTPGQRVHVLVGSTPDPAERFDLLRRSVEALRPGVVIVDTLIRWVKLRDANDYSAAAAAIDPLLQVARECGAHVLCLHHSRKGGGTRGEEALGSTGLAGAVDTVLSMKVSPEGRRSIYAFGRDGVDLEETVLELDEATGWVSIAGTTREASRSALDAEILAWLKDQDDPKTRSEVQMGLGRRGNAVYEGLKRLVANGRIDRSGRGKKNDPHRFVCCSQA